MTMWFYLSFANDDAFLSGAIVEAESFEHAVTVSHLLGINPGGQVLGVEIPAEHLPLAKYRHLALTKADILEIWPDSKRLGEFRAEGLTDL